MRNAVLLAISLMAATLVHPQTPDLPPGPLHDSMVKLDAELVAKYGEPARPRLERGLRQVASFWRPEDGDAAAFDDFVRTSFAGDQKTLDATFDRLEFSFEQLDGHMLDIGRELRKQTDLDLGPILPVDDILSSFDPAAHSDEDFWGNKLAFLVLLNFPLTTLDQRLSDGDRWSRRQWAEARLAERFSRRVPSEVNVELARTQSESEKYIAQYNIWMYHLLTEDGQRLFPAKLRLLSHWNLRDEIKADYNDPKGLAKQRMIEKVMERIVTQTIPAIVVDNPGVDWKPESNKVSPAAISDSDRPATPADKAVSAPEPDRRYEVLLANYHSERKVDPFAPTAPTLVARKFDEEREIPEARVRKSFEEILTSPLVAQTASVIQKRLGRPLEPFDIWYDGFRSRGKYTEAELDAIVSKRYPTADAYKADIPRMLEQLGFSKEKAAFVAANIVVDPARGSGHALQSQRRGDHVHLRTRVEAGGMNYKGYNIAVHEMGHNVEQTFSLEEVDHTLLAGVPNTAFTEALAFVFQGHDLELLGLSKPDDESRSMKTLNDFWNSYEIAGVALVDIGVWEWMYQHPDATPAQLREETILLSKDVWNRYYAPVFHQKDVVLLAVYSHMIELELYLPDYVIGHMIAFQIEQQMEKAGAIGPEFERMARIGRVSPDLWMTTATGAPVGPDALLAATKEALAKVEGAKRR